MGYCTLYADLVFDGKTQWGILHVTPIQADVAGNRTCNVPMDLYDQEEKQTIYLGGTRAPAEGPEPVIQATHTGLLRPTHFRSSANQAAFLNDLMVFSLEGGRCVVYDYDQWARILTLYRDGEFLPIGLVRTASGEVYPVGEEVEIQIYPPLPGRE